MSYTKNTAIKNDPWVKQLLSADTKEVLADLIVKRIIDPNLIGPTTTYVSNPIYRSELPIEIVRDFVENGDLNMTLFNESMAVIMERILKKDITPNSSMLENVFLIIEELCMEDCHTDLYLWINQNEGYMHSATQENRKIYLEALTALCYTQKLDGNHLDFWTKLWNQDCQYWWNVAFLGIRYSNFDTATSLIPELLKRQCSNSLYILSSMWRVNEPKFIAFLKTNLKDDSKSWAGNTVNLLASKMIFAQKINMIEKLHICDKATI